MVRPNGRKRVVISDIMPVIEGGQYPAKSIAGAYTEISANIFADGHDEIAACIYIRHEGSKHWQEHAMQPRGNDCWTGSFIPEHTGTYQFTLYGWIDHFTTWSKGILKKWEAGQYIDTELLIGISLLQHAAETAASKTGRSILQNWLTQANSITAVEDKLQLLTGKEITAAIYTYAERNHVTKSPVYSMLAERKKAGFSTWYELFPRSAGSPGTHGTFRDVKKLLPRIAAMGFDVLYFPPVHPIGMLKRKGRNNALTAGPDDPGSPWAVGSKDGGHKSIHPQLGTLRDFKELIAAAGNTGMEIAMDIAYQCAPDHPYVQEHPQWFRWRPDGTVQYAENPPKKYEDILPLNFESPDYENLWEELKSIVTYWAGKGIRIFRVDNPHTKAFPFWEWMIPEVRREYPDVIFLAEAFTRPRIMERLAKAGFTQSYTYFTWRTTKQELEAYMKELTTTDLRFYFRPNFWPNTPDILPPHLTYGGENAHIARLILAATLSANYGIYGPVYEEGLNTPAHGKEEYTDNEKYEIKNWDWSKYTRIREIITRVNKIRKEHSALQHTNNIAFATTTSDQVICYCKADKEQDDLLIIAVNLDPFQVQAAEIDLPLEYLGIPADSDYTVFDLLSRERYHWHGARNYIRIDPYAIPAHILTVEKKQKE